MKTRIFKGILTLAMMFFALPTMANDYLKIYFKDGHTERHYMHLVESISTTRYDLEGNLHDDYQMQQIVMQDTTYSYYLAEIDSMAFKKVDKEKVRIRVESIQSSLEKISQQCSNIDDLASHIDDIKRIDGVEEVYFDGSDLFIQILDWYVIGIINQPIPEDIVSSVNTSKRQNVKLTKTTPEDIVSSVNMPERQNKKSLKPITEDGMPMKVNIGFQMKDDNNFIDSKVGIDLLNTKFSIMGYSPNYELGDDLDFDFFHRRIFDSNVLFIDTHGGCGIFNKKHYLFTGIESSSNDLVGLNVDRWLNISKNIDLDDIGITTCNYAGGNLFNNPFGFRWYFTVTEDFIRKSPYKFTGAGPHIVFVAACSSLQGNDILTRSDGKQFYGNDSFAQVFFDKGADVYLGYNRGTYRSGFAAVSFLNYMIHGASVEQAYNSLHPLYKFEEDKDKQAALIDLYNQNSKNPKGIFIVNTHTVTKTDQEINEEFANNQQVKLSGTTSCWNLEDMHPRFGFKIATEPNIDESTNGDEIQTNDFYYSGGDYKEVVFSAKFNPEPGTKYYYRAFTHDNLHFNWGEERSFTIDKVKDLSIAIAGNIDLEVGASTNVRIMSGSGDYSLKSDKPNVAKPSLAGEFITVEALSAGKATITVTDNITKQTASFTVTVTDPAPTDIPAEAIDLGLPSGTLWASYNVGATKPEEYGSYFAWGETQEKKSYYFTNYSLCDGTVSSCHNIGDDISGTEYDVAHVRWGNEWCMPSKDDFYELTRQCEQKETTVNGVKGYQFTGPNGKSIFLPYAGYFWNTENSKAGTNGSYWSSTLTTSVNHSQEMSFSKGEVLWDCYINRFAGLSVRPVKKGNSTTPDLSLESTSPVNLEMNQSSNINIVSGSGSYTAISSAPDVATAEINNATVVITAHKAGSATITVTDTKTKQTATIAVTVTDGTDVSPGEAIDLGLPSGTLWASCNVGATKPEEYGLYFAWGETKGYTSDTSDGHSFNWSNYKLCNGSSNSLTKYTGSDGKTELDLEDDAAYVNWGSNWRMPSKKQQDELRSQCKWEWTQLNGVYGCKVTGPNGKSIFLPAAGWRLDASLDYAGSDGTCWSRSLYTRSPDDAYYLYFNSYNVGWYGNYYRYYGRSVRPVRR